MNEQRGVAVIMAILIVALAASLASALMWEQNLWLRQVENDNDLVQAKVMAGAITNMAAAILNNDSRNVDDLQELWAQPLPIVPIETGEMSGFMQDQQGRFNLNNLVSNGKTNQDQEQKFERLLLMLGMPVTLGNALADWLDEDDVVQSPGGAEDAYYLGLRTPYRAANRMLTEVGDLVRVKGFDQSIIERLEPFVTVLPRPTRINVNTASPEVLSAMVDGMTLSEARALISIRNKNYFNNMSEFRSALPRIELSATDADFSVASHFFLVTINTHFGRASSTVLTLLDREGGFFPHTVWQKPL